VTSPVGKSKATGYSDFYKSNSDTPGDTPDNLGAKTPDDAAAILRKKALKRRLAKMKTGS
jgi:hypothetical protein